jgi:hypothetical protein
MHSIMALVASVVVFGAVAWGFVVVGSPTTRRQERFDERRLQDLQIIARAIQSIVRDPNKKGALKEPLPASLAEAAKATKDERVNRRDPETGEPYKYTVKSKTSYELCATFSLARDSDSEVFWNHSAGPHCFTIDVLDPPPY